MAKSDILGDHRCDFMDRTPTHEEINVMLYEKYKLINFNLMTAAKVNRVVSYYADEDGAPL